jgi:hypothetical protein
VHGSFSFQLRESVGPILGPVSKLVLVPAISLDVAMTVDNAHFAAKVLPSGVVIVSVTFGGSFEWNGQHVTIGPTTRTITAGPADVSYLEQTASMVADAVVTDAANAFGFLFRDVKAGLMSADIWASSVGPELLSFWGPYPRLDPAHAVNHVMRSSVAEILAYLQETRALPGQPARTGPDEVTFGDPYWA